MTLDELIARLQAIKAHGNADVGNSQVAVKYWRSPRKTEYRIIKYGLLGRTVFDDNRAYVTLEADNEPIRKDAKVQGAGI